MKSPRNFLSKAMILNKNNIIGLFDRRFDKKKPVVSSIETKNIKQDPVNGENLKD